MYEYNEDITENDQFKPTYKYYKAKIPEPDFSNVLDFQAISESEKPDERVTNFQLQIPTGNINHINGFRPVHDWKAYSINDNPGFIFVLNPFKDGYQKYWVHRCLNDYPDAKNKANLDIQLDSEKRAKLWKNFVETDPDSIHKNDEIMGLRWTTLGYHYVWNNKEYHKERRTDMPEDLEELTKFVAQTIGYPNYCPEAGIVNYYHLDSTLGGHTDHAEFEQGAPLISFSFGQDCIFLLGGLTKETKPTAMFLRSGDICVMWKQSRLAYHGIPKILAPKLTHYPLSLNSEYVSESASDEAQYGNIHEINKKIEKTLQNLNWKPYKLYMSCSRINLNTRQVEGENKFFPEK
ncbi:hypothetical protein LOTGIDRAFT_228010 [Lottia gigantea]|uniref:Alpha-ketoglutarate-dependent dioxygenase AlkB-like domain-containing protein n=1 Tax=Lottia gigantea TaxID=225164 RepID=V4BCK9_LOTGI|nr:hypothetical protein LOTGIDRAFT_228010 [Lottia gigantea]ESP05411.1 hypothetical protein LOTGIDRAFT_228010 [Lottia gigantea]